ncbi:PE-PGRS family protein [Streptomyces sp. NPDC046909]|uniref:PE-PGRS family protein n=1 Tax=Streptomyces sp. NPDC046909 TaxID=3155617 RepID=UPI0033F62111
MADFRRQPEWQQQADRHSTLIDPVLTVRPIARFDYTARRPVTAIDHALVFATAGGAYDTYIPPHRPSRTDAATRRYTSVYEVDMGSHPVQLELQLPSDDDAFAFGATADLTWRVHDPEAFVRSGERDVPTRLTRELQQFARPVSRRYSIEDSPAAETAVQQAVESGSFAAGIGLAVTCMIRLRLDDEAIAHRQRRRALRYESEMLDPEHEFRMRQAQQQYELEALRQRQHQELTAQKIHFYQYWLQHGGVGAWALHLAAHPEDTQLVIGNIHQDQLAFIKTQLELISGDALEDYQKAESLKQIRREVDELMRRRAGAAQGELPAGGTPPYGAAGAGAEAGAPQTPYVPGGGPVPGTPPTAPYGYGGPAAPGTPPQPGPTPTPYGQVSAPSPAAPPPPYQPGSPQPPAPQTPYAAQGPAPVTPPPPGAPTPPPQPPAAPESS